MSALVVGDRPLGEILRKAGTALSGSVVVLWEADQDGRLHRVPTDREGDPANWDAEELEAELRSWNLVRPAGSRWVATRLETGRWCAAPVARAPSPVFSGAERRGPERTTLELAGWCISL